MVGFPFKSSKVSQSYVLLGLLIMVSAVKEQLSLTRIGVIVLLLSTVFSYLLSSDPFSSCLL